MTCLKLSLVSWIVSFIHVSLSFACFASSMSPCKIVVSILNFESNAALILTHSNFFFEAVVFSLLLTAAATRVSYSRLQVSSIVFLALVSDPNYETR